MKGCGAVIERELISLLRSRRTLWVLVIVAVATSLAVLLKWPTGSTADLSGARSRAVFRGLSYSMFVAVILVVPAFPATGVIREIRKGTMELLLNSPMWRVEIFFGKVVALAGFATLVLSVTLPPMACCYAMGGISWANDIMTLYVFLAVISLQLIVLGILVGTIVPTSEAGLRWVYGATFALIVLTTLPHVFLQGGESSLAIFADRLRMFSPLPGLLQLVGDADPAGYGAVESSNLVAGYLLSAAVITVTCGLICIYRLNHGLFSRSRSQGLITDDRSATQQAARRVFFLVDPQRRKSGIPGYLNPVMVKEFRTRQFGRLHWLMRLVAVCAVLSLLVSLATTMGTLDWGVAKVGGIMIVVQAGLIFLLTPGIAGAMIAGELETGGWNMLRATPLGTRRVLTGKLLSVAITVALVLCASLPGYGIVMVIQPVLQTQVAQVMASLVLTAVVAVLMSAVASSFFRSAAAATTVAYGLLIAFYGGTMLIWVNRGEPFSHAFVHNALSFNAMAGALNAMQVDGFQDYSGLLQMSWSRTVVICGGLLVVLCVRTWRLWQPD